MFLLQCGSKRVQSIQLSDLLGTTCRPQLRNIGVKYTFWTCVYSAEYTFPLFFLSCVSCNYQHIMKCSQSIQTEIDSLCIHHHKLKDMWSLYFIQPFGWFLASLDQQIMRVSASLCHMCPWWWRHRQCSNIWSLLHIHTATDVRRG
jgi:hypothetical protein